MTTMKTKLKEEIMPYDNTNRGALWRNKDGRGYEGSFQIGSTSFAAVLVQLADHPCSCLLLLSAPKSNYTECERVLWFYPTREGAKSAYYCPIKDKGADKAKAYVRIFINHEKKSERSPDMTLSYQEANDSDRPRQQQLDLDDTPF